MAPVPKRERGLFVLPPLPTEGQVEVYYSPLILRDWFRYTPPFLSYRTIYRTYKQLICKLVSK